MAQKKNKFDVLVIGGGVIGHSVGYQLSKEKGLSVALVDKYKPGKATWASCGGLWSTGESVGLGCGVIFFRTFSKQKEQDKDFSIGDANPHFMPQFFLDYADQSNLLFPELYKELNENCHVDAEYRETGLLFVIYDEADKLYAENIYAQVTAFKAELVVWLDQKQLREKEPYVTEQALGALYFPSDHDVNPYGLELALRHASQVNGATIIEETEVIGLDMEGDRVVSARTDKGDVLYFDTVVNSAGAWSAEIAEMVGIKLPVRPIRGQIILSERLPKMMESCISTSDVYIDQKQHGEILVGATTEDVGFNVRNDLNTVAEMAGGLIRAMPSLEGLQVKRTWAGLRPATPDELPIFGPVEGVKGYINSTGHFRTGIVTAPITGLITKAFVLGTKPPLDPTPFLYDRFTTGDIDLDARPSYLPDINH